MSDIAIIFFDVGAQLCILDPEYSIQYCFALVKSSDTSEPVFWISMHCMLEKPIYDDDNVTMMNTVLMRVRLEKFVLLFRVQMFKYAFVCMYDNFLWLILICGCEGEICMNQKVLNFTTSICCFWCVPKCYFLRNPTIYTYVVEDRLYNEKWKDKATFLFRKW